jgi:hypothetical protein
LISIFFFHCGGTGAPKKGNYCKKTTHLEEVSLATKLSSYLVVPVFPQQSITLLTSMAKEGRKESSFILN